GLRKGRRLMQRRRGAGALRRLQLGEAVLELPVHPVELALHGLADVLALATELAHELPDAAGELRELARAQDEQRDDHDEGQLSEADVEHEGAGLARGQLPGGLLYRVPGADASPACQSMNGMP